VSAGLVCCGLD